MLSTVQAKLLIVDDLPENLLALEALIKREDRQVFKALSADEALSLLLEHEFAMAILDVQMTNALIAEHQAELLAALGDN